MSAIDIVIFIDVIDLSHQIIELGKDRDDGCCEMLIRHFEDGGNINLSLPSPSQKTSFPVGVAAEH